MPQRSTRCLIERVLEYAVRGPQARRIACTAGRVCRHALLPELDGHAGVSVLVLVLDRNLTIPAAGVGCLGGQAIGAKGEFELVRLALVLKPTSLLLNSFYRGSDKGGRRAQPC